MLNKLVLCFLPLFVGLPLFAQGPVPPPTVISVPSTPSTCGTLPLQVVSNTNHLYGTNGSGGCSAIGDGGSGTVSGQANGVIPLATGTTTIGAQSHLDDGNTTAGTITSSESVSVPTFTAGSGGTASIVVTGTSTPVLNGTYLYGGTYSGWSYYQAAGVGYIYSLSTYPAVSYWVVEPTLGGDTNDFYLAQTNGVVPLSSSWTPQNGATGSITTSAGAAFAVDAAGDVLTNGNVTAASQTINGESNNVYKCTEAATGSDDSLKLQYCIEQAEAINSTSAIIDATSLTGLTGTVDPYDASPISTSGLIIMPWGTFLTDVPWVAKDSWGITCQSSDNSSNGVNYAIGGSGTSQGCTLEASSNWKATYSSGTVAVGGAGKNETVTGTSTSWSTNVVKGEAFVAPAGGHNGTSSWGFIGAVNSNTSLNLYWGQNNGTDVSSGSTYDIYGGVYVMGSGLPAGTNSFPDLFGESVTNMSFDCNNKSGCIPLMNWFCQQHCFVQHVNLYNYSNIGLDVETALTENSVFYDDIVSSPGSSGTANTIPFAFETNQGSFTVSHLSVDQGAASTTPTYDVDLEGNNVHIIGGDFEYAGTADVEINQFPSCPVACPYEGPFVAGSANGDTVEDIWQTSGTEAVLLGTQNGGPRNITIKNVAPGATDLIVDTANSCTLAKTSGSGLPSYILDGNGQISQSSAITQACLPLIKGSNTQRLTSDSSGITATTPGTTEWTWSNLSPSWNYSFHCSILFSQATGAGGVGVSVQSASHAATRWDAWAKIYTTNPASTTVTATLGSTLDVTSTTATSVASATPGATATVYQGELDGTIQTASTAGTLNVLVYTGNTSDAVTVKAGSYCSILP